ncbi:unnamed protein product [Ceutorhynchus assimilis]|uniref:Sodium channel protein Nach n=1 Tax=Ceutorhynchus assimilis TaxID=467358 RepID=A0A9N9MYG6_9CUCU|nr:unnamed protein product [Ceutorhynchus assimilis]
MPQRPLDYVSEQELLVTKNVISNIFTTAETKPNISELATATEVLEKNGYEEIKNIFKRVSQSCDELIVKCSWDQKPIECNKIFEETFTAQGRCCSFNYLGKDSLKQAKYAIYYGASTGLKVQIMPDFNKRNMAGVIVSYKCYRDMIIELMQISVHNPEDFPGGDDNMKKVLPLGRINYVQVKALQRKCSKEVKNLSIVHRKCLYSDERKLEYFGGYSYSNCLCLCEAFTAIEKCGCVPYYYDFMYEMDSCNLGDISCLKNISDDLISNNCNCPAQCEDDYYNFVLASSKFANKSKLWMLNNTFNYNENSIVLNIFFSSNWQTVWVRDVITSITYLISSFGGVYCLFLGCSIISLVEIFYYFIGKFVIQNLKPNNEIQAKRIFTIHDSWKSKEPVVPFIN